MSKLTGGQHIGNVLTTPLGATIRGQYVGAFLEVATASHIDDGSAYTNGDGSTYDAVRPPGGYGGGHHGRAVCSMAWNQDGGHNQDGDQVRGQRRRFLEVATASGIDNGQHIPMATAAHTGIIQY